MGGLMGYDPYDDFIHGEDMLREMNDIPNSVDGWITMLRDWGPIILRGKLGRASLVGHFILLVGAKSEGETREFYFKDPLVGDAITDRSVRDDATQNRITPGPWVRQYHASLAENLRHGRQRPGLPADQQQRTCGGKRLRNSPTRRASFGWHLFLTLPSPLLWERVGARGRHSRALDRLRHPRTKVSILGDRWCQAPAFRRPARRRPG